MKVFKSIFERLFWTNAIILIMMFLAISISLTAFVINYTTEKQYDTVLKASRSIEEMTIDLQIENHDMRYNAIYNNTLKIWSEFVDADITIVNQSGTVFASTNAVYAAPQGYVDDVLQGKIIKKRGTFGDFYRKTVLTIGIPIVYNNDIVGGMFFNTMTPSLNRSVTEIVGMFLVSASLSICLAFVLIYFQSRRISKPIKRVNRAAMDIASGKFDQRVEVSSSDEIGQLASSFNFMADSLERVEKVRSSFISDISHELRTPMTSISGFVQGILDHTIPEDRQKEYLQIVLDETQRLSRLVSDMLEMSKMQSPEYRLHMEECNINEIICRAIIQMEQRISAKNLELNVDFEKDVMMVMIDQDSIWRVVINLLDNAVKFSYDNTTITISVRYISGHVQVEVGNLGLGIEQGELRNIFDRFYKTDKSRSNDKMGAGLGLSFVKNILTCHNQSIWVESNPVKGRDNVKYTKFTFTLEKA
jgi:signal transduction histidine kinase